MNEKYVEGRFAVKGDTKEVKKGHLELNNEVSFEYSFDFCVCT